MRRCLLCARRPWSVTTNSSAIPAKEDQNSKETMLEERKYRNGRKREQKSHLVVRPSPPRWLFRRNRCSDEGRVRES
ncbi:hypothetical protein ERO13_A09G125850v2 [Gossypium hirsutum]|uniref:Uncharacterized protein n=1 Tax=Gossypium darwinii TaxID=34276 RepID=A0A5D2FB08_GOSDA|nr:hypothetical protein ERO13_A09G125850v2 [Gossypium hirsutum]TYH02622.1 hypothetical protein ES288_A09G155300v1 [Gossypium darwinii]